MLHLVPQAPQSSGLLCKSTQTPLQLVALPEAHTHAAFEHVNPALQVLPHAPQLSGSSMRRTHCPPQSTFPFEVPASPPPQPPAVQLPARQTSPFAHFVLQAPQFSRSTVTSTQTLLQDSSPAGHAHVPATHCCPFWQALPQAPQLKLSPFSSTHALLQFDSPVAHPAAQAPRLHAAIVLTHVVAHAPQFFGSSARFTQEPLHGAVPEGHTHSDSPHCSVAPHFVPHPPQLLGSLVLSTHALLHSTSPAAHPALHTPRLQTGAAPPQTVPHAPQFFGSSRRLAHEPSAHFTSVARQT